MKKARLGRGLDALLGEKRSPTAADDTELLKNLPIDAIQRGKYQPRTHMDPEALEELAQSIRSQGVVQPILVREIGGGNYEIIAGERRWRAAQLAGLQDIPAVVRQIPDKAVMAVALIENIQRENLNPLEEAQGIQRLLDEFGLTHQQAADNVGRSRTAVSNLLRLLTLNSGAKELLEQNRLNMGHARALLALPGPLQDKVAIEVADRDLSVRATENLVKKLQQQPHSAGSKKPQTADGDLLRLQEELSQKLGAVVQIRDRRGKGRLIISYHSLDELDGILERFG